MSELDQYTDEQLEAIAGGPPTAVAELPDAELEAIAAGGQEVREEAADLSTMPDAELERIASGAPAPAPAAPLPRGPLPTGPGFIAAETAKETAKGTFVPMAKAGAGTIQAAGGLLDFLGQYTFEPLSRLGKGVYRYGEEAAETLEKMRPSERIVVRGPDGKARTNWPALKKPEFWTDNFLETFTSISQAYAAGGGTPGGAALAGSVMEAGPMFEEMKQEGMNPHEAAVRAAVFGTAVAALEKIGFTKMLGGQGWKNALVGALTEAGTEWAEEPLGALARYVGDVPRDELTKQTLRAMVDGINVIIPTLLTAGVISGAGAPGPGQVQDVTQLSDAELESVAEQTRAELEAVAEEAEPGLEPDITQVPTEELETIAEEPVVEAVELKPGETVFVAGKPGKKAKRVTVVQTIDENTVRIQRESGLVEEVARDTLQVKAATEGLRRRGAYLAQLSKEERRAVKKADKQLSDTLRDNLYFYPVEAHEEIEHELAVNGEAAARATEHRWLKLARQAAARELGMDEMDLDDPRVRAEMLPKLQEWAETTGKKVMEQEEAERRLDEIKSDDLETVSEAQMEHGDLIYADGEWFKVDKQDTGVATKLVDGTELALDEFETMDVQGGLKPADPGYQQALAEYEAQEAGEEVAFGAPEPGAEPAPGVAPELPVSPPAPAPTATEPAAMDGPHLPIELPELTDMATQLGQGRHPKILETVRLLDGTALGAFRAVKGAPKSGRIELRADIFRLVSESRRQELRVEANQYAAINATEERSAVSIARERYEELLALEEARALERNPDLPSKVLAHEIGHWIDFLPDAVAARGNILGRIASLKKYTKTMLADLPENMEMLLTERQRRDMRNKAVKLARFQHPKGTDKKIINEAAKVLYQQRVEAAVKERGLVTRKEIVAELEPLIAWWRGTEVMPDYFKKPEEMYAEAFSVVLNNPEAVRERAPKFYDLFFNYLENKQPAMKDYDRIQKDIREGRIQDERDRRQMERHERADKKADAVEQEMRSMTPVEWKDAILMAIDRRFAPIYTRMKQFAKSPKVPMLRKAVADWLYHRGQHKLYLLRMGSEVTGPLKAAGVPAAEFNMYLENQHIVNNRQDIASMGGMNPAASAQSLAAQKARLGPEGWRAMEQAEAARWQIRQEQVLDLLETSRALDPEQMKVLRARVKYSTVAAMDTTSDVIENLFAATYGAQATSKIYRQVGYLGDAKSPLLATAQKDLSLITMAHQQILARELHGFLQDIGDPMFREAEYTWDENTKRRVPKEVDTGKVKTITWLDQGRLRGFYVSGAVHDMLQRTDTADVSTLIRMIRKPIQALKSMWTSLNYGFWPFNYIRDTKAFTQRMPGVYSRLFGKKAYVRYAGRARAAAKSISDGSPNADARAAMQRNLLIHTSQWNIEESEQFDMFEKLMLLHDVDPVAWGIKEAKGKGAIRKMWQKYQAVGERLERELKIAGMLHLDETQPNMPEHEKQRMVHEFAGSPNFMERGTMNWFVDAMFPFYNPAKQGYRAAFHAAQENPGKWALMTLKYSALPKLFIAAASAGMLEGLLGGWGDDLEEMLESISEYDKTNYDVIPIGWADKAQKKVLYWRGVEEEWEKVSGGIMSKLLAGDFDPRDLLNFAGGQVPGLNPYFKVGGAWRDYFGGRNPTDRTAPIVDPQRFKAGEGLEEMIKWTANQLGAGLVVRFNRDNFYDPDPTFAEKVLNAPVLSNTIGRFLRVSNAGLKEKARERVKPLEKAAAKRVLRIREVLAGEELTPERIQALMTPEGAQYFQRSAKDISARGMMDPYQYYLFKSRHQPRKVAALMGEE